MSICYLEILSRCLSQVSGDKIEKLSFYENTAPVSRISSIIANNKAMTWKRRQFIIMNIERDGTEGIAIAVCRVIIGLGHLVNANDNALKMRNGRGKSLIFTKMQYELPQVIARFFFTVLVISLVAVNAKPPHFPDNTQGLSSDQDSSVNNLIETGLRPWQLEMLAQRMAELNQLSQINNLNGQDYGGFDRALRSGNEIKRQSRYRLCYFNPVSCFKK